MAFVGVEAPGVVVRPPNIPAPPPISLLTQNNVEDDESTVLGDAEGGRWEGGGGTQWLEVIRQWQSEQVWQTWPDSGDAAEDKRNLSDGTDAPTLRGETSRSPVQRPLHATMVIDVGALADWVRRSGNDEGTTEEQALRALDVGLHRTIERELWTSAGAVQAGWEDQFRLKTPGVVTNIGTAALPFRRALAAAEKAAADFGFIDQFGGAFVHMTPALFSLVSSPAEVVRSPSGRQVHTLTGLSLIPEIGATGAWSETATAEIDDRPGGSAAGDDAGDGWLFVTPPVRVRRGGNAGVFQSPLSNNNDTVLVAERGFILEASVLSGESRPTSIAIPVDYTQEI